MVLLTLTLIFTTIFKLGSSLECYRCVPGANVTESICGDPFPVDTYLVTQSSTTVNACTFCSKIKWEAPSGYETSSQYWRGCSADTSIAQEILNEHGCRDTWDKTIGTLTYKVHECFCQTTKCNGASGDNMNLKVLGWVILLVALLNKI